MVRVPARQLFVFLLLFSVVVFLLLLFWCLEDLFIIIHVLVSAFLHICCLASILCKYNYMKLQESKKFLSPNKTVLAHSRCMCPAFFVCVFFFYLFVYL